MSDTALLPPAAGTATLPETTPQASPPESSPVTPAARWSAITNDARWLDPLSKGALNSDQKVQVLDTETMNRAITARSLEGPDYDLAMGMIDEWYRKERATIERHRDSHDAYVQRGQVTPVDNLVAASQRIRAGTHRATASIADAVSIALRKGAETLELDSPEFQDWYAKQVELNQKNAVEVPDSIVDGIDPRLRERQSKIGKVIDTTLESAPQMGIAIAAGATGRAAGLAAGSTRLASALETVAPFLYTMAAEGSDAYHEAIGKLTEQGMSLSDAESVAVKAWVEQGTVAGALEAITPVMFLKHLDKASGGQLRKTLAKRIASGSLDTLRTTIAEGTTEFLQEAWGQNVARRYFIDPNLSQPEREALISQWKISREIATESGSLTGFLLDAVAKAAGVKGRIHVTKNAEGKRMAEVGGVTDIENRLDLDHVAKNGPPITESFLSEDPRFQAAESQAEAETVRQVIAFERSMAGQPDSEVEFRIHPGERTLADEITSGTLTEEDAFHRIRNASGTLENITDPADVRVFGRNSVEFRDNVYRQVVDLYKGATPQDVAEEMAEAWFKTGISSGRLDLEDYVHLKHSYEEHSGETKHTDDFVGVTEWFSGRAGEYLTYRTRQGENASEAAASFGSFLQAATQRPEAGTTTEARTFFQRARLALAHTLKRARQLIDMMKTGKMDPKFEADLRAATGLDMATLQAPEQQLENSLSKANAHPPARTRKESERQLLQAQEEINTSLDIRPPRDPGLSQSEQSLLKETIDKLTPKERETLRDLVRTPTEERARYLKANPVSDRTLFAFDALMPDDTRVQDELLARVRRQEMADYEAANRSKLYTLNEAIRRIGGLLTPSRARAAGESLAGEMEQIQKESKRVVGRFRNTGLLYDEATQRLREYGFDFQDPRDIIEALARSDAGQEVVGTMSYLGGEVTFSLADNRPLVPPVPHGRLANAVKLAEAQSFTSEEARSLVEQHTTVEERAWLGFETWMATKLDSVSKSDLAAFIDDARLPVRDSAPLSSESEARTLFIARPAPGAEPLSDGTVLAGVAVVPDGKLLRVTAIHPGSLQVSDPFILHQRVLSYAASHGYAGITLDSSLLADTSQASAYALHLGGKLIKNAQTGLLELTVGSDYRAASAGLASDPVPVTYSIREADVAAALDERITAAKMSLANRKLEKLRTQMRMRLQTQRRQATESRKELRQRLRGEMQDRLQTQREKASASRKVLRENLQDRMQSRLQVQKEKAVTARDHLRRDIRTLEGIIAELPLPIRGRLGGFSSLAKIVRTETREKYLLGRIERALQLSTAYERELHLSNIDEILSTAETKIAGTERTASGKLRATGEGSRKEKGNLGGEGHRLFETVSRALQMREDAVETRLAELEGLMGQDIPERELANHYDEWDILTHVGNIRGKSVGELARAESFLQHLFDTYRTRRRVLEEARSSRWKEARVDLRNATKKPFPSENEVAVARTASQTDALAKADAWMVQKLDAPQFLERMFPNSTWARAIGDRLRAAVNQVTDRTLQHHRAFAAIAKKVLGVSSERAVNHRLAELMTRKKDSGLFYYERHGRTEAIPLEQAARIASGEANMDYSDAEAGVIAEAYQSHQEEGRRLTEEARKIAHERKAKAETAKAKSMAPVDPDERTNTVTHIEFSKAVQLEAGSLVSGGFTPYPGKSTVVSDAATAQNMEDLREIYADGVGWQTDEHGSLRLYHRDGQAYALFLRHKPGAAEIDAVLFPADLQGGFSLSPAPATPKTTQDAEPEPTSVALAGWRRRTNLSVEFPGTGRVEQEISQFEAAYDWLLLNQKDYAERREQLGFPPDALEQLEKFLQPETKALALYMQQQLGGLYDQINPVFERLNGSYLPQHENYFPGVFDTAKNRDAQVDPFAPDHAMSAFRDGFTKRRVLHSARRKRVSAFHVFFSHLQAAEHYIGFAEIAKDMRATMLDPGVNNSLVASRGAQAETSLGNWLKLIEGGGSISAELHLAEYEVFTWLSGNLARAALAWKATTTLVQSSNIFASMADIPAGQWLAAATRLATSGRLGSVLQDVWQSPDIQRRLEAGFSPEMKMLLSPANPRKANWVDSLSDAGLELINRTDAGALAVSGAIAYDWALHRATKAGMSPEAATAQARAETSRIINRVQQPTDFINKSLTENAKNPVMKMGILMFLSDPRRKVSNLYMAAWKAAQDYKANPGVKTALSGMAPVGRLAMLYFMVFPFWESLARGLAKIVFGGEKPEDAFDEKEILANMATGPMTGLPIVGLGWELAVRHAMDLPTFSRNPLLDSFFGAHKTLTRDGGKIFKSLGEKDYLEATEQLGKAINHIGAASWGSLGALGTLIFQGANAVRFADRFMPLSPEEKAQTMLEGLKAQQDTAKAETPRKAFAKPNLSPVEKILGQLEVGRKIGAEWHNTRRADAIKAYLEGFVEKKDWGATLQRWESLEYESGRKLISRDVRRQLEEKHAFKFPK